MKPKTQYFIVPGQFTVDSSFLIKFDGHYSYWGSRSKKWICDPGLFHPSWIRKYSRLITEREVRNIIKEGAPQPGYRRSNPKAVKW